MALSTEFCAHATGLAATLTGAAGEDVCFPEFHRPADSLPTFSVFVFATYKVPPSKRLKPAGFPFRGAAAIAARRSKPLPAVEGGALRLQIAVVEADEYPRRFLAAVTAAPLGFVMESAAAAAEGMADTGTLGGVLLAALRRVAATSHQYPHAWHTLGGTVASLATAWLAAGLVYPSEAREAGGDMSATDGMPQPFLRLRAPIPVPHGLPRSDSVPKPTAVVAAAGSIAAINVAATTCAACIATRLYRCATTLGSFGYRVALGAPSSQAVGVGGTPTMMYGRLIVGVPLCELPMEEAVLRAWGLTVDIPDKEGRAGPSGSETPVHLSTSAKDGNTSSTGCSPLLVVEVSGGSLDAAASTTTRTDATGVGTLSRIHGVPSAPRGSIHMDDWAAVVRSWAGWGPPTAAGWPLTDCIQRSLLSAATTAAPRFTTTREEAAAAVSCPPLALLHVASARAAAVATACVVCDADTGAAAGYFGACPAICVKGGPDSCVEILRRRVASGGWPASFHRPALEPCSWPEPEPWSQQSADDGVPTEEEAQSADNVPAGERGGRGDRSSGDGGGNARDRVPASVLRCLGAALRTHPVAVDLLLYFAGAAAVCRDGSALDPAPPFLQLASESGGDNGGGGGTRRSPTLLLSPSGRDRFVSALRATPAVADLAAAAARSDADLLAALDDAHPDAAAIAAWVVASMPGVIRAVATAAGPAGEPSPPASSSESASQLPPRSFLIGGGDPAGEWAFQVAVESAAVALSTATAARTPQSLWGTQKTTKYVFHGSPLSTWHSILRNGLDTRVITNGRSHGDGVYVSSSAQFAAGYGHKEASDPGYVASVWAGRLATPPSVVGVLEAVDIEGVATAPEGHSQASPRRSAHNFNSRAQIVPEGGVRLRGLVLDCSSRRERYRVKRLKLRGLNAPQEQAHDLEEVAAATAAAAAATSVPAVRSVRLPSSWRRSSQPVLDGRVPSEGALPLALPPPACVAHAPTAGAVATGPVASGRLSPGAAARIMRDLRAVARDGRAHGLEAWPAPAAAVAAAAAAGSSSGVAMATAGSPLSDAVGEDLTVVHVHMGNWASAGGDALPLAMDLAVAGMDGLLWEVRFPPNYPATPPFVRLLRPRMLPWAAGGGGHLTSGGSVCLAVLTPREWAPSIGLLELLITIRAAVGDPHPVPARVDTRATGGYGLGEALRGYARVGETQGWLPRGRGADLMSWVDQ